MGHSQRERGGEGSRMHTGTHAGESEGDTRVMSIFKGDKK